MDDPTVELAQDLTRMSVQSRNEMNEEIHGLRTLTPEETPEMVQDKLRELNYALNMLPSTPSYDEAMGLSSELVKSSEFRMRFLRAETFDARKAAIRMEQYLTFAKNYFGPEALHRPSFMSDLDKQEQEMLKAGNLQLLDSRDRFGRRIVVRVGSIGTEDHSMFQLVSGTFGRIREIYGWLAANFKRLLQ